MKIDNKYRALALASIAFAFASCGSGQANEGSAQADSIAVRTVDVATIERDTIDLRGEYTATLTAKVTNNISAQSGGRLAQLLVQVGDRVGRGQVVARLDAAQLNQAKIQLDDATTNYRRVSELYEIGGISKAQWEQARSTMNIAQEAYNNLMSNTVLRSPIAGVVTAKNYDAGDMTSPSQPVVVVEQVVPVKAVINVSETYYKLLKKGMQASVAVDALGGSFDAYVANVYPTIDATTHTIPVEVEIPNRDALLRPGMYSRVSLDLGRSVATLVPDKAVQRMVGSGQRYVYVYTDGKAVYRPIEIGELHDDRYAVLSGLEPGEVVIVSSAASLTNGAAVQPQK